MDIITHIIKFNSHSNGRDKICRLFQYTSKYVCWYASKYGNQDMVMKMKNLDSSLSASRKVFRIGKSLDFVDGVLKSLNVDDPLIRSCLFVSRSSQAVYMLVDHSVWAAKIGLVDADAKLLSKTASKLWLLSLIFNLIRNLYDMLTIIDNYKRSLQKAHAKQNGEACYSEDKVKAVDRATTVGILWALFSHKPLITDTVKNSADLLLPLTNLGYANLSLRAQGILGMISSIMGILTVWNPDLKLRP